jgi:hypothetical protein
MPDDNPYLSPLSRNASRSSKRPRRLSLAWNSQTIEGCVVLGLLALASTAFDLDTFERVACGAIGMLAIAKIFDGILRRRVHRTRDLRFKRKPGEWIGLRTLFRIDADTRPGKFRTSLSNPSE